MKKLFVLFIASMCYTIAFSQNKDTSHVPHDTVKVYYFTLKEFDKFAPDLEKRIFQVGWQNVTPADVFKYFIQYLDDKKQFQITTIKK